MKPPLPLRQPWKLGRPKLWSENMTTRSLSGTFARGAAMLEGAKAEIGFMRTPVEKERKRREAN